MLKKLYKLGQHVPEEYFEDNPLGLNFRKPKEGTLIYFLCFRTNSVGNFEYTGVDYEEYDLEKNKNQLYLYKNIGGRGTSPFMTIFYEKIMLKENCIALDTKSGRKIVEILKKNIEKNNKLLPLSNILNATFMTDPIFVSDNFILSLKINDKYLGEWEEYQPIIDDFVKEQFIGFYNKYSNIISKSSDSICYICQKRSEVWGFVDTFKFYSANEDSVVSGGFSKKDSWRNYPVCSDCALKLEKYKDVVQTYLSFNFYGFNYLLIPEIILDKDINKEVVDILFNDKYGLFNFRRLNDTNKLEDELIDILRKQDNLANFTLFFYEENNSEFKIILSIDDVFPSRFNTIYKASQYAEGVLLFKNLKFKDGIKDLKMNFGIIKHFFPKSKIEGDFSSYFLEIVRSIFVGKKVDYDFVLTRIVFKLRNRFINDEHLFFDVLNAMLLIRFINYLDLWNKKEQIKEREVIMESNKYNKFLDEHKDFFDNNTKKAIFLEGVLCQFLLNIQHSERNSTPFKSKLNGLKLDEKYIKKLLPEIVNKLEEYDKNYYRELENMISKYMLESKFDMSNDEISFYFVMGMNLAKEFKNDKENNEEVK